MNKYTKSIIVSYFVWIVVGVIILYTFPNLEEVVMTISKIFAVVTMTYVGYINSKKRKK